MKKPNITEGEWYVNDLPADGITIETREFVICRNVLKNNAQAISAVPEMLDALIDLVKVCPIEAEYQIKALEKGREALEKAGVENA